MTAMSLRTVVHRAIIGLSAAAAIVTPVAAGEPVRLYVTVDKAELVNLPSIPITKISLTNPNIADVYVVNPTQILLSGRQAGTTTLMVFSQARTESFDVVVHNGPIGQSRARLIPAESHTVEVQRAGRVSQQLFVRDEDRVWIQLGNGNGKAEPEAPAK
jgi:Flp pilus assembly secretin CpaC